MIIFINAEKREQNSMLVNDKNAKETRSRKDIPQYDKDYKC